MFRFRFQAPAAPLVLGLALATAPAVAQPEAAQPAATLEGSVQRLLPNPHGDLDGLLLADGSEVHLPPHLSDALKATVAPGDAVRVEGWRENPYRVRAWRITDLSSGRSVEDRPPDPRAAPPTLAPLTPLAVQGRIVALLHAPRGEIDGAVLDDGSVVRFPPRAADVWQSRLRLGALVTASGYGTENDNGRALEATRLGLEGQTPQPLYAPPPR
jgi:hypothetical protein